MASSIAFWAAASTPSDLAAARIELTLSSPVSLRWSVVIGVKISSSWSLPAGLRPLAASTPMTRSRSGSTRIVWPSGFGSSGKSLERTVWPMTQTSAASAVSSGVKKRPEVVFQSRTPLQVRHGAVEQGGPVGGVGHGEAVRQLRPRRRR